MLVNSDSEVGKMVRGDVSCIGNKGEAMSQWTFHREGEDESLMKKEHKQRESLWEREVESITAKFVNERKREERQKGRREWETALRATTASSRIPSRELLVPHLRLWYITTTSIYYVLWHFFFEKIAKQKDSFQNRLLALLKLLKYLSTFFYYLEKINF